MGKMDDLLNWARKRPDKLPAAVADGAAAPQSEQLDPRTEAERVAEEAGAKWRAEAEAKGEIPKETGGPKGLEPTRYGDWEKAGRCFDF